VSDFIEEKNRHLIVYNEEGDIMKDAWHIIYPRVGGNTWWDQDQLISKLV